MYSLTIKATMMGIAAPSFRLRCNTDKEETIGITKVRKAILKNILILFLYFCHT